MRFASTEHSATLTTSPISAGDRTEVRRLAGALGLDAGALEPLEGSRNRLWRAGAVIVRLGRAAQPFADPATECANMALAAGFGIAPEVIHVDPGTGAFVVRRAPGAPLDAADGAALERAGQALARLHAGQGFAGRLDPAAAAMSYADALDAEARVLARQGVDLWAALAPGRCLAPCHNDALPANLLDDGRRVLLIDWEYAALNDPAWDVAYLAVEAALDETGFDRLLAGYGASPPFAARARATRPMVCLVNGLFLRLHGQAGEGNRRLAAFRAALAGLPRLVAAATGAAS